VLEGTEACALLVTRLVYYNNIFKEIRSFFAQKSSILECRYYTNTYFATYSYVKIVVQRLYFYFCKYFVTKCKNVLQCQGFFAFQEVLVVPLRKAWISRNI